MIIIFSIGRFTYRLRFLAHDWETDAFVWGECLIRWGTRKIWGWKIWSIRYPEGSTGLALYAGTIRKGWMYQGPVREIPV